MSDFDTLQVLHEVFDAMFSAEKDFIESAKEASRFYTGSFGEGQWSNDDLDKLRNENRPPLQLNIIKPKVNLVVGIERQQRTRWKARPVEFSDDEEAELITSLLFYLDRGKQMQNVFSRIHKDGVITGRGWVDIYVEPGLEFTGEIFVKRESWAHVLIDPEADSPDTSQWSRLARTKWLTLSKLKSLYPDELSDLTKIEDIMATDLDTTPPEESDIDVEYGSRYTTGSFINEATYIDKIKKRARVVELWERDWETEYYLVNQQTNKMSDTGYDSKRKAEEAIARYRMAEAKMEAIEREPIPRIDFNILARSVPKTYVTVFSGGRLLIDRQTNPYSHNQFPLVPYFYYFEDVGGIMETFGLVENMKDPQREKNKRRSQALDILNRTPRGGGVFIEGTISPDQMNKASSAGEWVGIPGMKGKRISDFMQQWSTSHLSLVSTAAAMEERAAIDAKEISGATDPLMGKATSSKESGFAAQTRIRQGMLTLEEQMDNLDKTKRQVLELCIRNMQQFWTPEKINRILGYQIKEEDQPEQAVINRFLSNFTNTNFDVELDDGMNSPTMRAMKAEQVGQMIQMGFQSLFPLWLELSDIESADDIKQTIEEEKMAQMMMQQAQGQMPKPAKG
jgi:hypothetical protein|tara:strand:+ start:1380 stop:3248 length:1869 start_codon:yes stop_codon:yes gene_type:complete